MKRVKFWSKSLLVALALMTVNNSCTNLDEELYAQIASAKFFKTDDEFVAAVGAAYTQLYGSGNHNAMWSDQEVSSDEMIIPQRGGDWLDGGQWLRMHRHEYNAREESFNNAWNFCFGGVIACNRITAVLTEKADPAKAAPYLIELQALRAIYYYWLLDMFGNVPIVDKFPVDGNPATKTRAEVFAFVEKEIAAVLPKLTKNVDGSTYGRVNYWVLKGYQAKLYLNAGVYTGTPKYTEALAAANEIIGSGKYSLETNFTANFKEKNDASKENMFVVPYDFAKAQGFNWDQMTLHYASQATYNLQSQPWNGYCSLTEFYNSFDNADARKKGSFVAGPQFASDGTTRLLDDGAEANDPDGKPLTFTPEINQLEPGCLRQAGVRIGKYEYAIGATPNMSNDFVLMRYADFILVKAECLLRNGDAAGALVEVNKIRARAGAAPFTTLTLPTLLAERGREMFAEGVRRQDMIRFGTYTGPFQFKTAVDKACIVVFPIPQNQLNTNPALLQNECYK
jgi:starch-binding outer membrane protein, SusD/RagB family